VRPDVPVGTVVVADGSFYIRKNVDDHHTPYLFSRNVDPDKTLTSLVCFNIVALIYCFC
jgi:hypothetical protein